MFCEKIVAHFDLQNFKCQSVPNNLVRSVFPPHRDISGRSKSTRNFQIFFLHFFKETETMSRDLQQWERPQNDKNKRLNQNFNFYKTDREFLFIYKHYSSSLDLLRP